MCLTEYDEESAIRGWREDGRQEQAVEAAKTMLSDHLPTDKVALYSGLPLEQVLELQKELAAQPAPAN